MRTGEELTLAALTQLIRYGQTRRRWIVAKAERCFAIRRISRLFSPGSLAGERTSDSVEETRFSGSVDPPDDVEMPNDARN